MKKPVMNDVPFVEMTVFQMKHFRDQGTERGCYSYPPSETGLNSTNRQFEPSSGGSTQSVSEIDPLGAPDAERSSIL